MLVALSALLLVADANAATAQAPAAVTAPIQNLQVGKILRTADGRRVGEIIRIDRDASGKPRGVVVIFGSGSILVPAETLSDKDRGLITSLGYKEIQAIAAH